MYVSSRTRVTHRANNGIRQCSRSEYASHLKLRFTENKTSGRAMFGVGGGESLKARVIRWRLRGACEVGWPTHTSTISPIVVQLSRVCDRSMPSTRVMLTP